MSFSTGAHVTVTGYLQAGHHGEHKQTVYMNFPADASLERQNKEEK